MDKNRLKIRYTLQGAYSAIEDKDYKKALRLCKEISDEKLTKSEDIYYFNQYIGEAYLGLCQFRKAVQHFTESIKIAKQMHDHNGETMSLQFRGEAYEDLKDYKSAEKDYKKTIDMNKGQEPHGLIRIGLARVYAYTNRLGLAKKCIDKLNKESTLYDSWIKKVLKLIKNMESKHHNKERNK